MNTWSNNELNKIGATDKPQIASLCNATARAPGR
jgi:hypothetical protein